MFCPPGEKVYETPVSSDVLKMAALHQPKKLVLTDLIPDVVSLIMRKAKMLYQKLTSRKSC